MVAAKLDFKKTKESIILGVKKTFEEMAFIDVTLLKNPENNIDFKHILYVDILEPVIGKIALYLPFECKKMIAENVYGKDLTELNTDEIDDCQLEILNVLVGNYLSFLYGGRKKYKIDLPRILFDEGELHWKKSTSHSLYFDAEGVMFKVVVDFKNTNR